MSVEEDVQDRETVDTETMAMQKDEENDSSNIGRTPEVEEQCPLFTEDVKDGDVFDTMVVKPMGKKKRTRLAQTRPHLGRVVCIYPRRPSRRGCPIRGSPWGTTRTDKAVATDRPVPGDV